MSNSNTNLQTQSSNALYNAIMEAGSKDRPPMLAPGNYVQWKSRIKRYIDTKPNSELIHYCLQNPPYTYQWAEKTVPVAEGSSETTTERYMENYKNVSQDIRDQLNAEAEAVQIILTGIDNDIYSTVDACPNACEMWKAIERLKQGESINVQDLETNLYWEFGKFTSRDGESLESYYSRFYKMMNELSQELKTVSYHKLYDILKQHQNEVNEIRAERLARTANPLALVAQQQPVCHHQDHPTQNTQYSSTRSQQSIGNKGKTIVTSSAPTYDPEPATVTEDEEMSKGTEGVVDLTQWFERMETVFCISNCTVENQVKFATCTLMGIALTWWNSHVRTVTNDVAYAMTWTDLKKKMITKYYPRNEIKKIEAELWNLKVKDTDVVAYNQRFQELALLCDRMFPEETDKIL
ncbi:gag-pol polyprotein, partial [Tanacetum coccineum]